MLHDQSPFADRSRHGVNNGSGSKGWIPANGISRISPFPTDICFGRVLAGMQHKS